PVARAQTGHHLPPIEFWHALTPRDPAGSAVLRATDAALASRLLDACGEAGADPLPAARGAVAELTPGLTDKRLVDDVARVVGAAEQVRRLQTQLRDLLAISSGPQEGATARRAPDPADADLVPAIVDLVGEGRGAAAGRTLLAQIRAVAAAATGVDVSIPPADPTW